MSKQCCTPKKETPKPTVKTKLTVALCGNPNCGKTTLFNVLTGSNQKVGNWPGVTVERKIGAYKANPTVAIVDTPGIYSLSPFTIDEQVAHQYLMEGKPDLIINIVDSTNLERNLFLTSQLMELDVPVVVALNMQDEAKSKGIQIDSSVLEEKFGCKFFNISASKNQGVEELMNYCTSQTPAPKKHFVYSDAVEDGVTKLKDLVANRENSRWVALKLLEKDKTIIKMCNLSQEEQTKVEQINKEAQEKFGDIVSARIAEERYGIVSELVNRAQRIDTAGIKEERAQRITQKIDKIVLNKWLAFPIFAVIMALVFYISIGGLGGFLTDLINDGFTPWLQNTINGWFANAQNIEWLRSLIVDGIIAGVMSVVSFVPQIMLLFGFIAVLEASGYMSRIAFITDRLLNKIGLGGRSFVSMILGCGCSVPAIMSTRTIKNINERNATITLTPFMPCSAKLAIISFFTTHLLGGNSLFAVSFYFLSIFAVILGGLIMKVFRRRKTNASDTFIMELPTYRAPTVGNVAKQMWDRGKAFLIKAGTIIFTASVLLWLLQSFNWRFEMVATDQSMLASIGKLIAPIFIPLGFNDGDCGWQFAISTLTGIAAKETVVTTLQILLPEGIDNSISALGAYSFVVYNLLTIPCVAAISASFSEQGNWKNGLRSALFQIVVAYIVSLAIYQLGTLARKYTTAFIVTASCVVIAFLMYFSIRYIVTHRGCNYECDHCPHNADCKKER